ncbi:helix-turn-helix transcriptional regulator [Pseudomonas sp. CCM 7891]|uniref:Helix-turn-helix transcriptional regulator n=1 Tax=Pseudomonas karstica TaxID=1055468 RepID=A0A7X2RSH9_9PSED|nr:LuxR C-terminal-related transcriptional regulator [Pseudomonas karstica]MTD19180.1 helix-turn-helix transcriptional regulator [Pseudomonas karstica]
MGTVINFGKIQGTTGVLAEQELRAALAICAGLANKEIARAVGCAPGTVKKSIERVFYKLGVTSRSAIPAELFCRGIARHMVILICAVLTLHAAITDDHMNRIRRPGERRVETRVAVRRIEAAHTV